MKNKNKKRNENKNYLSIFFQMSSKDHFTFSLPLRGSCPWLIMLSRTRSAMVSRLEASMSRMTVPFRRKDRSSKRECRERVATWGLDHRSPPSSTSSSNLIHLQEREAWIWSRFQEWYIGIYKLKQNVILQDIWTAQPSYLAVSFHSSSPPSISIRVSISLKRGWLSCVPSPSSSSPRINCTLWLGGVTEGSR